MNQPPGAMEPDWQPVSITHDAIYINGIKLPGYIAEGGVVFRPGGTNDINRLEVTFLVGPVEVTDPMVHSTTDDTHTRYSSKPAGHGV